MKNTKRMLLALMPLLLTGCNAPSTESSSSSAIPNFYDEMQGQLKDGDYIYDYLTHVANKGNYTLSYSLEGVDCYDLFNESYYYTSILESGAVLLPYVELPTEKILYRFELKEGKVEVLLPETSGGGVTTSVNDISYFSLFTDPSQERYNLSRDSIKKRQDGVYYTDSPMANLIFCASVGYIGLAQNNLIKDTTFSFLENGDLSFTINALSMDANGDYKEAVITKANFSNVDASKIDAVDAFKEDYQAGEELKKEAATLIEGDHLTAKSEITLHEGNEAPVLYAKNQVSISPNQLCIKSNEIGSKQVYSHFFENQKGRATVVGIDGHNNVVTEDGGVFWKELSWPKDLFSASAFRKIGEDTYRYLGLDAEGLFYSYSYLNFEMAIKTLDIVVESGTLKEMNATFYRSVSDLDSSYFHYTVKTIFEGQASFVRPTPFDGKGEEATQATIQKAFEGLKAGSSYVAVKEDYGGLTSDATRMILAGNIVYFETYSPVTVEVKNAHGFVEKEGKIIPFTVSRDPATNRLVPKVSGKSIPGDCLDNHIGFSASPLVFELNEKNQIVPKSEVLSLADCLIVGEGGRFMIPSTLTMSLDASSRILNINYRYEAPIQNGQGVIRGYDQISFRDYGTAMLPPNLTRAINELVPLE